MTEHGVETRDWLSSLLLKGTEKLRFPRTRQRKASMRVNCVQFVCKWTVGVSAQCSGEQKKEGHTRCLKLGFTVPMRKQCTSRDLERMIFADPHNCH